MAKKADETPKMDPAVARAQAAKVYNERRGQLLLVYPELANDGEALRDTLDGETDAQDMVVELMVAALEAEEWENAAKALSKRYAAAGARHAGRGDALRAMAKGMMEAMGEKTIKRPQFTLSIATIKPKPVVYDEAMVPAEFKSATVTVTINMDAIKAAIEATNIYPPGVNPDNGGSKLQVR